MSTMKRNIIKTQCKRSWQAEAQLASCGYRMQINGNWWGALLFIIIKHNFVQPFL